MNKKELSIEEKAKAYDKALAYAKLLLKTIGNATLGNLVLKNEFEKMFPELKEDKWSEEERIRKDMIETIKKESKDFPSSVIAEKSHTWLAWLEKQGERKSIDDLTQQEAMDIAVAKCFEQEEQKSDSYEKREIYCRNRNA